MNRRTSWLVALLIVIASGALMGLIGTGDSAEQSPVPVPAGAESARADALRTEFPGGDRVPAILVVSRGDGAVLTPADLDAADQARQRMLVVAGAGAEAGPPVQVSEDRQAAVAPVPLRADLSGFDLNDTVKELRAAASDGLPGIFEPRSPADPHSARTSPTPSPAPTSRCSSSPRRWWPCC